MEARQVMIDFGRLGRTKREIPRETRELEIMAMNGIAPRDDLARPLKCESVYRRFEGEARHEDSRAAAAGR